MGVPEPEILGWMQRAERLVKGNRNNKRRFFTSRDVFLDFLATARAAKMDYMPDPKDDGVAADRMTSDEVLLLGGDSSNPDPRAAPPDL